ERLLRPRARHVDHRHFPRYRNRLGNAADFHVGVHRRNEVAGELDAFTLDGAEPAQRERHGIRPRPEVLEGVLAGTAGDHRPCFLDEGGAGCLDGDSGQHRAGWILDRSHDRALRIRSDWNQDQRKHHKRLQPAEHCVPPICAHDAAVASCVPLRATRNLTETSRLFAEGPLQVVMRTAAPPRASRTATRNLPELACSVNTRLTRTTTYTAARRVRSKTPEIVVDCERT